MFLFFTFDLLNLNIFGMLSIPLLIIFFPMSEPSALELKFIPVFIRSLPSPLPVIFFMFSQHPRR